MVRGSFVKTFVWCILPRGAPSCCGLQKPTHFLQTQLIEKQYLLLSFYSFSHFHISIQFCRHISYIQLKAEKTMAIFVAFMYLKLFEAKKTSSAEADTKTIYQGTRGLKNNICCSHVLKILGGKNFFHRSR